MLHRYRLFMLLTIGLAVLGLSRIVAQDATPISSTHTETPVPTLPLIETPTDVPSQTPLPTLTPTPLPTETPTLLPTPTETETASETPTLLPTPTESETPTLSASESPAPTLTVDASLSPTITLTASATAPATSVFPTAQPLTPLFSDNFDTGDVSRWTLGPGWGLVASEGGQALQTTTDAPLMLTQPLGEGAVEARLQFSSGTVQLTLRQGASGSYAAQLSADGQVKLLVTGQVVTSTTVAANQAGQWRTLRLTAANSYLRVAVDGMEVLAALDAAPLPPGTLTLAGVGAGTLLLDDVNVFIAPTTPIITPVIAPTNTLTATGPVLPTLYTESFENPQFNQWFTDIRNSIVSVANGHALHVTNANAYLALSQGNVLDVAFQADINLSSGIASLGVRHSGAGYYRVALNANGTISLYRTEQTLATFVTPPFVSGQWRTVKFSVIGNTLHVALDNVEVLNFTDTSPLPSGTMFIAGNVEVTNDFLVDNLIIQGTITPLRTQSSTTDQALLKNQQLSAQILNNAIPSGTSQRIVFAKDVSTTGIPFFQLFIMDDCGGNQTQLLTSLTSQYFPDLSLEGQIAFIWDFTGNFEIYTMNYDGSNLLQRTNSAGFTHSPSWFPDGSKIALERGGELYILNLNTGQEQPLATGQGSKALPKWSPDGQRITFQNYINNVFDIFAVNIDGSNLIRLTNIGTASHPDWSPDSTEIVFLKSNAPFNTLWVMDSGTGAFKRQIIEDTIVSVQWPSWSLDGSTIVYSSGNSSGGTIPTGPYIVSVSSGLPPAANNPNCGFGTLTGAGHMPNFGLVPITVQVTPTPNATPNTTSPTTPQIEECNSFPYKWWVKNKHSGTYPRPNLIIYESHHGVPTAYFRDALVPLLAALGINIPYSNGLAPTIEMPQTLHYQATSSWNGILDDWNLLFGQDWKNIGIPWTAMVGSTPGEFGSGSIVDRLMDAGRVPQNCRELYKKALKEYLEFILCKVEQSALRALIANPPNQAAQALKQIVDWLGGVDAIFQDCPGSW